MNYILPVSNKQLPNDATNPRVPKTKSAYVTISIKDLTRKKTLDVTSVELFIV